MGKRRGKLPKSQTLPSSPSHSFSSSSSSDFEFTVSRSPHKSPGAALCPADDLFYMGQLLPLHLSPRLSMVRNLLLASSSSSSDSATTSSRDSSGSSADSHSFSAAASCDGCDSSRPSSAAGDEIASFSSAAGARQVKRSSKYFSLSRFSAVFRKDAGPKARADPDHGSGSSVKRAGISAREVIRKYLKKVRPLYGMLSQAQQKPPKAGPDPAAARAGEALGAGRRESGRYNGGFSQSFSGNLRYPRRRSHGSSCPSSIRSSPSRAGVPPRGGGFGGRAGIGCRGSSHYGTNNSSSSTEELQSAIQGAIAYCKSSMIRSEAAVSREI